MNKMHDHLLAALRQRAATENVAKMVLKKSIVAGCRGFSRETLWAALQISCGATETVEDNDGEELTPLNVDKLRSLGGATSRDADLTSPGFGSIYIARKIEGIVTFLTFPENDSAWRIAETKARAGRMRDPGNPTTIREQLMREASLINRNGNGVQVERMLSALARNDYLEIARSRLFGLLRDGVEVINQFRCERRVDIEKAIDYNLSACFWPTLSANIYSEAERRWESVEVTRSGG